MLSAMRVARLMQRAVQCNSVRDNPNKGGTETSKRSYERAVSTADKPKAHRKVHDDGEKRAIG